MALQALGGVYGKTESVSGGVGSAAKAFEGSRHLTVVKATELHECAGSLRFTGYFSVIPASP